MTMSANMIAKGSEAQPWSILEKLLLAQCVYKFGEDNWPLISKTLRQNALISRSSEFFNQKNCSLEYFTMIEELESARRLAATAQPSTQEMAPVVKLARQLYLERIDELKAHIKEDEKSFRKLVTEIDEIRSGKWDAKLKELIPEPEPETAAPTPMDISDDSNVQSSDVAVAASAVTEEVTPPVTNEGTEAKTEVEEKTLEMKIEPAPSLVSEAAEQILESNINSTSLESNTMVADAAAIVSTEKAVATHEPPQPTPEVAEVVEQVGEIETLTTAVATEEAVDSSVIPEEPQPNIPEGITKIVEDSVIVTENDTTEQEMPQPPVDATAAIPADEPQVQEEISMKRKPEDSDLMDIDTTPKRARTESRSPSLAAESTHEAMSPVAEVVAAVTPVETPEKKPDAPAAVAPAVDEMQDVDISTRVPNTPEGSMSVASNAGNSTVTTPGPTGIDRKKGTSYSKELEQRQKSWQKNINLLWREISNHKNGAMFMNPIKENIAPRYYEIVKRPMDLKQIKQRIREGSIRNTTEFERDVLLMLTNSLIYNKEGTEVYQMALEMLEDVQEQIRVFKTADAYSSSSNVPKDTSHGLRRRSIVSDGGSIQGDADNA